MIRRLKCRLGFHKWAYRDRLYAEGGWKPILITYVRCRHCDTPEFIVNVDTVQGWLES